MKYKIQFRSGKTFVMVPAHENNNMRSFEINLARHPLKRNLGSVVVVKSWNVDHPMWNEDPKNVVRAAACAT